MGYLLIKDVNTNKIRINENNYIKELEHVEDDIYPMFTVTYA